MTDALFRRRLFDAEHDAFRDQVRRFVAERVRPFHLDWERAGIVPRELWREAGAMGLLCCTVPEAWGGAGGDFRHTAVVLEEMALAHAPGPGFAIHGEMATPYLVNFASDEHKARWLPRLVSGDAIAAIAMTEPSAGSDLRAMRTRATRQADGGWRLRGQKVFISNGQLADVIVVAARTDGGLSLFVVDAALPGVRRGRRLEKMGQHAQDTSELFFDDVALAAGDLLGDEGGGMKCLAQGLARERLTICVICQARAEAVFRDAVAYVGEREVFGQSLATYQNTRFVLAGVKAELMAGRAMVDGMIADHLAGELDETAAAAGKLWITEMLGRTVDACLQLYGGWGYMTEYPISRAYADARVERIAGGTSEIMKEIIARGIWPRR